MAWLRSLVFRTRHESHAVAVRTGPLSSSWGAPAAAAVGSSSAGRAGGACVRFLGTIMNMWAAV